MKNSITKLMFTAFTLAATCAVSHAAIIAGWNAFDSSNGANFPAAATTLGSNISSGSMASPANLITSPGGGSFVLWGWENTGSVNQNNYLQFSVNVQAGYKVDFSSAQLNGYFDSVGDTLALHVRSSADSFASDLGTMSLAGTGGTSSSTYSVNLSSLANQTGTVTFRIYGTGDSSGSGFLWGNNGGSVTGGGFLALNGTVSAVPEPEQYAVAFGLGLVGFAVWRRRFTRKA